MELGGRTLTVDVGRVAKQANGAALMHYGDTTVLSTATASEKPREGIDFFPLSVEFEEKMYSVGKIPGGFNKREGKASENAVLTARVIDRPMRPLFPKDYRNDCTLNNLVLSVDPDCRPELVAMLGSAIATSISDIPFDGPCATTQIGMIDGQFIVNPTQEQWKNGDLNLTVASTKQKVIMIEAGANEIPEDKMIEAIYKAHDINQEIIAFIDKIVAENREKIRIAQVAEKIGISRSYLMRIVKEETGVSPQEYLIRLRMTHGVHYLLHTNLDIQEVARNCGYEDGLAFSKAFKSRFGMNPTDFRNIKDDQRIEELLQHFSIQRTLDTM